MTHTTTEKPAACYREATNGVHFTRNAHRPDCDEIECRGCVTCAGRHCTARKNCTWHVDAAELTCGRCLGAGRRDIRWIEALTALTLTQAISDGVDSQAAVLAGPAADPRGLSERRIAEKRFLRAYEGLGRITEAQHLHAIESLEDEDWQHAYSVLTRYQMMFAEDYDHPLPGRLSVSGAAAYLDRHLHRIAQDPGQDFPELAASLKKCRQHLEAVLHNDTKPDQGAPCPKCREGGTFVRLKRQYAHWCTDDGCERFHFLDVSGDTWHCPRDAKHWWTQDGYAEVLKERQGMTA